MSRSSGASDRGSQTARATRGPSASPCKHSDEGLWQQRKGGEGRQVCCVTRPRLRGARRDAVRRVRHKPRLLHGFFRGANLEVFMHWYVMQAAIYAHISDENQSYYTTKFEPAI
jgi:hypothetical protein